MHPYKTISDIRERNHSIGGYYFHPNTVRKFNSRQSEEIWPLLNGSALFIDSVRQGNYAREYKVMLADKNGRIHTVCKVSTLDKARCMARRMARHTQSHENEFFQVQVQEQILALAMLM